MAGRNSLLRLGWGLSGQDSIPNTLSMKTAFLAGLGLALCSTSALAQQVAPGLTLFNPNFDTKTYLIDNNGVVVHTWNLTAFPGVSVHLDEDGTLLRTKQVPGPITIGGWGGGVERVAFDGSLLWDFTLSNAQYVQHHEALTLPNGNVLMIAWERLNAAQAIGAGRNPANLSGTQWLPDALIEIQPTGPTSGVEVWRWRAMDHLIQDFDPSKPNFGVVADHPERININWPPVAVPQGEWMHSNGIDYDEATDQIVISVPEHDEIWIIDHSTTTAEAAGSTGGNQGKGGDLLYRWGNPQAYGRGTAADQTLHYQHNPNWIAEGLPGAGNLLLFNNRVPGPPQHSEVFELTRQNDASGAFPVLGPGQTYGPAGPVWSYAAPNPGDFTSPVISGAQRLANGNTLICSGAQGWLFEVTNTKSKVWQYFNNFTQTGIKYVFRANKHERYLWSNTREFSAAAGGTLKLDLVAGTPHAGELYAVLGSFNGTTPGLPIDGFVFPLVSDAYFNLMLTQPNVGPFGNTFGVLDGLGRAQASVTLPAGAGVPLIGKTIHHAWAALDPATLQVQLTSHAEPVTVVP